jgi:hypothetical protein
MSTFSNPVAEAAANAVSAVHRAQSKSIADGFELVGQLLEQQRAATLALLEAFTAATPARKS